MSEIAQEDALRLVTREEALRLVTQEEALRLADALVGQALKETETRCAVLAEFIHACDRAGSRTGGSADAVCELSALQARRRALIHRRGLIQQALDCPVAESPAKAPLPPPDETARRPQRQVQLQARTREHRRGAR